MSVIETCPLTRGILTTIRETRARVMKEKNKNSNPNLEKSIRGIVNSRTNIAKPEMHHISGLAYRALLVEFSILIVGRDY